MYYAKPYGLTRDELRYILDRNDVYGSDFLGETFRVLVTEFFSPKQEEIAFVIPGTPYFIKEGLGSIQQVKFLHTSLHCHPQEACPGA